MWQLECKDVVGKCVENPTLEINNFCWSFVQDLKRGYNLRSSVCMMGEWLSIQLITLLVWIACFPPTYGIFSTVRWKTESLYLQTLWLYQQWYVLCCLAWINFITCCLFLNRRSWTSELTLGFPASLVQCCTGLQLKALLATCVWLLKSAELSVSFKNY